MAKAPAASRVKTRLARAIGLGRTTGFARAAIAALLCRVGRDPRWQTWLAVTPDTVVASRLWPRHIPRLAQGPGDLGARMLRIFARMPPGPVVIVGTDIPGIRADAIARAFRALGVADAVLGPAQDGGYWLIGLRRQPRLIDPFAGVRWSSPDALADTLANLGAESVAMIAELEDVDEAEAFARQAARLGRRVLPPA